MKELNTNVFDELYNRLQKRAYAYIARVEVKYAGNTSKINSATKNIQSDLANDLEKLKFVIESLKVNEEKQTSFMRMMNYITDFKEDGITENGILDAILAYGVLQMEFPKNLNKMDDETAYLLTTIMSRFNKDDFDFYGIMVTDPILLENVMKKSPNMNDRREIMEEVCSFMDDFDLDELTDEQYLEYLAEGLKIVERSKIGIREQNR